MRAGLVEVVLLPEDDVLGWQRDAVEVEELGGEDEPFGVAVGVEQQDLLVLVLAVRTVAYFGRDVAEQVADVPLHYFGLAVSDGLNHKGLVETDDAHEVIAETGLQDVQQLLRELLLQVGGVGGLEFLEFHAVEHHVLLGLAEHTERIAFRLDEFALVLVPAGLGIALPVKIRGNAD